MESKYKFFPEKLMTTIKFMVLMKEFSSCGNPSSGFSVYCVVDYVGCLSMERIVTLVSCASCVKEYYPRLLVKSASMPRRLLYFLFI